MLLLGQRIHQGITMGFHVNATYFGQELILRTNLGSRFRWFPEKKSFIILISYIPCTMSTQSFYLPTNVHYTVFFTHILAIAPTRFGVY